jgi:hypothetical protein
MMVSIETTREEGEVKGARSLDIFAVVFFVSFRIYFAGMLMLSDHADWLISGPSSCKWTCDYSHPTSTSTSNNTFRFLFWSERFLLAEVSFSLISQLPGYVQLPSVRYLPLQFCLCVFFICSLRVVVGDSAVPVYGNGQVAPFFMQHGILELFQILHYVT